MSKIILDPSRLFVFAYAMNSEPDREIANLKKALEIVMAAVGMFQTRYIPGLGRCGKCGDYSGFPDVHWCRKCATQVGLDALGINLPND